MVNYWLSKNLNRFYKNIGERVFFVILTIFFSACADLIQLNESKIIKEKNSVIKSEDVREKKSGKKFDHNLLYFYDSLYFPNLEVFDLDEKLSAGPKFGEFRPAETSLWKFECNPYPHVFDTSALTEQYGAADGFGLRTRRGRCMSSKNEPWITFKVAPFDFRGGQISSDQGGHGGAEIAMNLTPPTDRKVVADIDWNQMKVNKMGSYSVKDPSFFKKGNTLVYSYWVMVSSKTKKALHNGFFRGETSEGSNGYNMNAFNIGQFHTGPDLRNCDINKVTPQRTPQIAYNADFTSGYSPGPGIYFQHFYHRLGSSSPAEFRHDYRLSLKGKAPNHPFYGGGKLCTQTASTSDGGQQFICPLDLSSIEFKEEYFDQWINIAIEMGIDTYNNNTIEKPQCMPVSSGSDYPFKDCAPSKGYLKWYLNFEPIQEVKYSDVVTPLWNKELSRFEGITTQLNRCPLFLKLGVYGHHFNTHLTGKGVELPLSAENVDSIYKELDKTVFEISNKTSLTKTEQNLIKQHKNFFNQYEKFKKSFETFQKENYPTDIKRAKEEFMVEVSFGNFAIGSSIEAVKLPPPKAIGLPQ